MRAVLGKPAVGGGGPGPVQSQGGPARQGDSGFFVNPICFFLGGGGGGVLRRKI